MLSQHVSSQPTATTSRIARTTIPCPLFFLILICLFFCRCRVDTIVFLEHFFFFFFFLLYICHAPLSHCRSLGPVPTPVQVSAAINAIGPFSPSNLIGPPSHGRSINTPSRTWSQPQGICGSRGEKTRVSCVCMCSYRDACKHACLHVMSCSFAQHAFQVVVLMVDETRGTLEHICMRVRGQRSCHKIPWAEYVG